MLLPASKYLTVPFRQLGVLTNAPPTFMRHSTDLLLNISSALQTKERYNTHPITYMMRAHSGYKHKNEIERIASTLNILSNRYPFKLSVHGRNMDQPLDELFIWGWVNGCKPQIQSVFMLEYVNPPLKCQVTTEYIEMVKGLDIRKYEKDSKE